MVTPRKAEGDTSALSSSLDGSCNSESRLHDSLFLSQKALADLQSSVTSVEQWRRFFEKDALFGQLHPYEDKNGHTRWNYYPHGEDLRPARKDKRQYVRMAEVGEYRKAIACGEKAKRLRAIEQQLVDLLQEARSLQ